MVRASAVVALRWDGPHAVKAAREAIAAGSRVEIELPLEDHYALYRHLHPESTRAADRIDESGDAELIASVATVAGMEEIRHLRAALRRARYSVRLTSPAPLLTLIPPPAKR